MFYVCVWRYTGTILGKVVACICVCMFVCTCMCAPCVWMANDIREGGLLVHVCMYSMYIIYII